MYTHQNYFKISFYMIYIVFVKEDSNFMFQH